MMTLGKFITLLCSIACLATFLTACQKQEVTRGEKGPAEQIGQQFDQAAARAGEQLNKAAEKVGQSLQEAGRQLQDKAAEAQKNNEKKEQ